MDCKDTSDGGKYQLVCVSQLHNQEKQIAECKEAIDKLSCEIRFMKMKFKEMAALLQELAETVDSSKAECRNSCPENTSFDIKTPINTNGYLIWGIDNLKIKMEDAVAEGRLLRSPTFLTSDYGYKFQVVAHLNGTGQWKDKCMIFSIEHCPTHWDVVLPWPCRLKITFTLVDQNRDRSKAKDVTKQFTNVVINKRKKSFRTFFSKEILKEHHYLNNESILIIISVKEKRAEGAKDFSLE